MARLGPLLQGLAQAASGLSAGAGVSSEGSPGDRATLKLRRLQAGFSSLLAVGQRSPSVPCHMGLSSKAPRGQAESAIVCQEESQSYRPQSER